MIEILDWKVINKNSLLGFATIKIPKWGNFIIHSISVFQKGSHQWITMPSRETEDKDNPGKKKYYPYIRFENAAIMRKFEEQVLSALANYQPKIKETMPEQMEIPF